MTKSTLAKAFSAALLLCFIAPALGSVPAPGVGPAVLPRPAPASAFGCASQLLGMVDVANESPRTYRTPVFSKNDDRALIDAAKALKAQSAAIQESRKQGKIPSPALGQNFEKILEKPTAILKRVAPKELSLCMSWMDQLARECAAQGNGPAKSGAACAQASNLPAVRKSMDAFMSAASKRILQPRT